MKHSVDSGDARFRILTAVLLKIRVFRDITSFRPVQEVPTFQRRVLAPFSRSSSAVIHEDSLQKKRERDGMTLRSCRRWLSRVAIHTGWPAVSRRSCLIWEFRGIRGSGCPQGRAVSRIKDTLLSL